MRTHLLYRQTTMIIGQQFQNPHPLFQHEDTIFITGFCLHSLFFFLIQIRNLVSNIKHHKYRIFPIFIKKRKKYQGKIQNSIWSPHCLLFQIRNQVSYIKQRKYRAFFLFLSKFEKKLIRYLPAFYNLRGSFPYIF